MTGERLKKLHKSRPHGEPDWMAFRAEVLAEIDRFRAVLTARDKAIGVAEEALHVLVAQCDTEDHLGPMIAPAEHAVRDGRAALAALAAVKE